MQDLNRAERVGFSFLLSSLISMEKLSPHADVEELKAARKEFRK